MTTNSHKKQLNIEAGDLAQQTPNIVQTHILSQIGTTARCAIKLVGINRKTAAYYYHFPLLLKECECRFNNPKPQAQLKQLKLCVKKKMGWLSGAVSLINY